MQLALQNVHFAYAPDAVALRGVDLSIAPGERVAIIGANGAGKTTLVKQFNGLLKPQQGRVLVGDWDTRARTVAQMARRVGLVFQNPDDQLFKQTVADEVAFGPRNLGFDAAHAARAVDAALAAVGLSAAAETHPYDLSTAQRKLVALATILAMETPVVVWDEPTIGQDGQGLQRLGEIVAKLHENGRTIITISHDIDFCADYFERIVVMAQGRIIADGPATAVFAQQDVLAQASVTAPQLARLGAALNLPGVPLGIDAFIAALRSGSER
jgi:energy-coupling factor transport system ATP-binding protein